MWNRFNSFVFGSLITSAVLTAASGIAPLQAQSVVVSGIYTNNDVREQWVELVVTSDNVDMRNWTIRDNNNSHTSWTSAVSFANIGFWNNIRRGTVIIIHLRPISSLLLSHTKDINKNDGFVQVAIGDTFFTGGSIGLTPLYTGSSMNIDNNGDMVQLRNSSGTHVHALAFAGTPGTDYNALPSPKAHHSESSGNNKMIQICPGDSLALYNGSPGTTLTSKEDVLFTKGLPNQCGLNLTQNSNYWRKIRQPDWVTPGGSGSYAALSGQVNLSWNVITDPNPSDLTMGYIVVRSLDGNFTHPVDGTTYTAGNIIGGNTLVIANLASSQISAYVDLFSMICNQVIWYRVYAFRYTTDNLNGNNYNTARGRAYNETSYSEIRIEYKTITAVIQHN